VYFIKRADYLMANGYATIVKGIVRSVIKKPSRGSWHISYLIATCGGEFELQMEIRFKSTCFATQDGAVDYVASKAVYAYA